VISHAACSRASKLLAILTRDVVKMVVSRAATKRQIHSPAIIVFSLAGLMLGDGVSGAVILLELFPSASDADQRERSVEGVLRSCCSILHDEALPLIYATDLPGSSHSQPV
jgi:hypothetical protein